MPHVISDILSFLVWTIEPVYEREREREDDGECVCEQCV